MSLWPFKKKASPKLTPTELRDRLIDAARSGAKKTLMDACTQYKDQVADNLEFLSKVPDVMYSDEVALDAYIQNLLAVAQCLANECNAPELWTRLSGTSDGNPLEQWDKWFAELPKRIQRLEYDALIAEVTAFIETARFLQDQAAREKLATFHGRRGELLFHSGKAREAATAFRSGLKVCREIQDVEGERAYLGYLVEIARYLGEIDESIRVGEELIRVSQDKGLNADAMQKRLDQMRRGEPLSRVACLKDGVELDFEKVTQVTDGSFEFQFRRNRMTLQLVRGLVQQGNVLASADKHVEAQEKYQRAREIDPHDPDPVYQLATSLMEQGNYRQAREAFETVERLAPGWFHCRSDLWLSEAMQAGKVTAEEYKYLRMLESGNLTMQQATQLLPQAITKYPKFAPFYLILGEVHRSQNALDKAIASYRQGLQLVSEPDLESRLLCAAATILPKRAPERIEFLKRLQSLNGNPIAKATAELLVRQ